MSTINHDLWRVCVNKLILHEKCPNTEFFLVRIFLYSDWMQENTDQRKLRLWILFTQCKFKTLCSKYVYFMKVPLRKNHENPNFCETAFERNFVINYWACSWKFVHEELQPKCFLQEILQHSTKIYLCNSFTSINLP